MFRLSVLTKETAERDCSLVVFELVADLSVWKQAYEVLIPFVPLLCEDSFGHPVHPQGLLFLRLRRIESYWDLVADPAAPCHQGLAAIHLDDYLTPRWISIDCSLSIVELVREAEESS